MDEKTLNETLKIFRIVAGEFAHIPDEDTPQDDRTEYGVKTYIDLFHDQISEKRFGKSYTKALAYLTAHKLKMMDKGEDDGFGSMGAALRVSSASEGETSVSFGSVVSTADAESEYGLTIYGIEFLTLKRNAIIPIVSAGEPIPGY